MSESKNLQKDILVIETPKVKHMEFGFFPLEKSEILDLEKEGIYKIREQMETDKNFQQFIPYIAFKKEDKILLYQRTKKGGENRLFDKWSLGIGGHVDFPDKIFSSAIREIEEEVGLKISENDLQICGLINIEETPVDMHHIGIAMILDVDENFDIEKGELDKLINRKFIDKNELEKISENLEAWSKIFYQKYLKNIL